MPAKLDSCVEQVKAKGRSESSAFAICTVSLGLGKTRNPGGKKPFTHRNHLGFFGGFVTMTHKNMTKPLNTRGFSMGGN